MRTIQHQIAMTLFAVGCLSATDALVPAASFEQGGGLAPDANPPRRVTLSAYRIDLYEVTIKEFERFAATGWNEDSWWSTEGLGWRTGNAEGAGAALRASGRDDDHPVVAVTWFEAEAFCRWRGGRLPTEAEWEYAACSPYGSAYAWGPDTVDGPVWYDTSKRDLLTGVHTQPSDSQAPTLSSQFGLLHSAGNVWEWTRDSYDAYAYQGGPASDPVRTDPGPWKVLRGGSYMNLPSYCSCKHREPAVPDEPRLTTGFRCAYAP